MDLCTDTNFLTILSVIKNCLNILKIVVSVLLIIIIMVDYFKLIHSFDEEEIKKVNIKSIKRFIAAVVIFFIPTIIGVITNMFGNSNNFFACLRNSTPENINLLIQQNAENYIDIFKNTLLKSDYEQAKRFINDIENEDIKNNLLSELLSLESYIIDNSIPENNTTDLLNVESGIFNKKYAGNKIKEYYEIIPEQATINLPLIIFLHGDNQQNRVSELTPVKYVSSGEAYNSGKFIFIAPVGNYNDWTDDEISKDLQTLINDIIKKYQINQSKIIITGFSRGAIGTWDMVYKNPDLFSAAVPVSCCPEKKYSNYSNFTKTAIWALENTNVGDASGCYEGGNLHCMSNLVDNINNIGGYAKFNSYNTTHGGMQKKYESSELFLWMLSQTNENKNNSMIVLKKLTNDGVIVKIEAESNTNIKGYYFSYDKNIPSKNEGYLATNSKSFDVVRLPGTTYVWAEDIYGNISESKSITLDNSVFIDTKNYKYLNNTRLDTFLNNNGWSIDEFENLIYRSVRAAGLYTKKAAATAAVALPQVLAQKYQVKLPYLWGGKSYSLGLNGKWGSVKNYNGDISNKYYALDCTGFVTWAYINAGYIITSSPNWHERGNDAWPRLAYGINNGEIGDFIDNDTHIRIIIGKTEEGYIVAEESIGMMITTYKYANPQDYLVLPSNEFMKVYNKLPSTEYPSGF